MNFGFNSIEPWAYSQNIGRQFYFSQQCLTNTQEECFYCCEKVFFRLWKLFGTQTIVFNNGTMIYVVSNLNWWLLPAMHRVIASSVCCHMKALPSMSTSGYQCCRLASHTSFGIPGLKTDDGTLDILQFLIRGRIFSRERQSFLTRS